MNLWLVSKALGRHKLVVVVGVLVGVVLALLSLYAVSFEKTGPGVMDFRPHFAARSLSVYSKTTAVLIDVPGFGLVRTDLPIDQNSRMAPAFAYMAMSSEVVNRVEEEIGPLKGKVEVKAEPVEDSPVVQIVAEGRDPVLVVKAARTYARALSDYVTEYQDTNGILADVRVVLRPVGATGAPVEIQSRAIEIAAVMFLLPVFITVASVLALDNMQRSAAASKAADPSPQAPSTTPAGSAATAAGGKDITTPQAPPEPPQARATEREGQPEPPRAAPGQAPS